MHSCKSSILKLASSCQLHLQQLKIANHTASAGKKPHKKKMLLTSIRPTGWTPNLNKKKPKRTTASKPVLPSSVSLPSPPSAQPPKIKRKDPCNILKSLLRAHPKTKTQISKEYQG
ncbi:hypothetical protein PCASD_26385 [Puccinia coronata f. sp. avenae]|uniref:Uncharacterized protein n=1 Tax=Puccinia coronata f. sp. avenae TaxID=200324 RepID=A0A2N5TNP1_9BASI|nr:hypothetical protein PCASD_26385 [Puccinia coronata f. sp. avenae]